MIDGKDDPLTFVDDWINDKVADLHPPEIMLSDFVSGKIESEIRVGLINTHLELCSHCKELANMFGWPESNTKH